MELSIYPEIILRVPQFHLNAVLENEWEELKQSIRYSSPEFYQIIEGVPADELQTLPRSVYHSVWKYFNRAKYRPTPYGSFAGFGIIHKRKDAKGDFIQISNHQRLHRFICWTKHGEYYEKKVTRTTLLFSNSSYYVVLDKLRYIVTSEDNTFGLYETNVHPEVVEILKDCHKPVTLDQLMQKDNYGNNKMALVKKMIRLQLLLTDASPNIIGEDYFKRMRVKNHAKLPQYILAEREVIGGYPDQRVLRNIPDLVSLMNKLNTAYKSPVLDYFKTQFKIRFGSREVALMCALDPELGINIIGNEQAEGENDFINSFHKADNTSKETDGQVLKTLFLKMIYQNGHYPIRLEYIEHDFKAGSGSLPNSMGMLCSIVDEQVIVESIGGASATSILGRYTLASEAVSELCTEIASAEQNANPDVLFFDIAYISEVNADNVNRREQIYPLQLSILNFDTSADPLTLDDLYVCVINDEILLYSRRLNKRMVPRLSTAYNYNRSDLPLFRFLCELQFQGLKANLGFNLTDLMPGLQRYPRIQYRNIVLSPAKWLVSYADLIAHIRAADGNSIQSYLKELGMSGHLLTKTEDRTLCFCMDSTIDMAELQYIIKKFDRFYLEEGFIPAQASVQDTNGSPYNNQLVLSIRHGHKIYDGLRVRNSDTTVKHSFPAGTEWLYYEIYAHPLRSDYLLQDKIAAFLKAHRNDLERWFFIRYTEGGEHIRLRLKLKNLNTLGVIMVDLAQRLDEELASGLISDYNIKKYQRETERYSPELIEYAEYVFFKDSTFVISILKRMATDYDKYQLCIDLIFRIRDAGAINVDAFDEMIDRNSKYFLAEHNIGKEDYKRLNREYKNVKGHTYFLLPKTVKRQYAEFESTLVQLLSKCPPEAREQLLTDLIHMHINRLFHAQQRTHEMAIYYFVVKHLLYYKAVLKVATVC